MNGRYVCKKCQKLLSHTLSELTTISKSRDLPLIYLRGCATRSSYEGLRVDSASGGGGYREIEICRRHKRDRQARTGHSF